MEFLGVDIGRSSIKHGLVSLDGEIEAKNFNKIKIPHSAGFKKYSDALKNLLKNTPSYKAVGVGFPCVIRDNKIHNTDIDFNEVWSSIQNLLQSRNIPCFAINDADAAGIAEVFRAQAVELRSGVTVVLTLGSGIGSAIFIDGKLLPNTELGLMELHGISTEDYAAPSVITRESLSIQEWASRLQEYLAQVDTLFNPDHLVLGGGISTDFEDYRSQLSTSAHILPAYYRDQAGVIGAAMYASDQIHHFDQK